MPFFPQLGFGETLLIFAIFLLLFGAKRLPDVAAGLGRGIREFKRAVSGVDEPPTTPTIQSAALPSQPPTAELPPAGEKEPR
jgi:TatA/E family protein of Tat protein translocase